MMSAQTHADWTPRTPWPTVRRKSAAGSREVVELIAQNITADSLADPHAFARQSRLATALLPAELRELLFDFLVEGDGGLLLSGLEVGPIPPTPDNAVGANTRHTLMARQSALLLSSIVHLVGYRPECRGELVQTLVPVRRHLRRQTSTGSAVDLESHTEQCHNLRTRPDFIALGCLRGDPNASTYLLSARELQRRLPAETSRLLRDPVYFTRVDSSFIDGGVPDEVRGPIPVLSGSWDDPVLTYDEDLMSTASTEHRSALAAVRDVWMAHRSEVVLHPGELFILDNSRAIHGRSAFTAQWDGGDRWLCRTQGLCNLATSRFARREGSPIIEIEGC
ncbi:L-asparagine oxygenase [Williamsia muralis]|uniref:L-asparagine oxygenase n=2 Tax=Williamsia marianensis TaxID=85044 RepID=A0A495K501_WILMA|nr:TauD/TfdA family dioxygenase [Williamsia muralis]RKR96367.1 L-asparagine oxygenase [Williamsia muralis]